MQLDHQSRGRVIFGSGPGALPSDAHTLGMDPMVLRDRQDEAMGVIRRLFETDDRFTYESEWFTLRDARLQLKPFQEKMEFAVASILTPSGMTLAGKHEAGVLSIGSMTKAGIALPPAPVELRGGVCRKARQDCGPQELAHSDELAHRRDPPGGP